MSHTPGPWKVVKYGYSKRGIKISRDAVQTEDGHYIVTEIFTTRFGEKNETLSNANLLAAAPDLLNALKVVMQVYDTAPSSQEFDERFDDLRGQIYAAIAKAEGTK